MKNSLFGAGAWEGIKAGRKPINGVSEE